MRCSLDECPASKPSLCPAFQSPSRPLDEASGHEPVGARDPAPKALRKTRPISRRQQRGAAVVEFALILPILLLLLLGTIEGSLALYDKAVITNASREGARAGIVARNPPLGEAEIRQVVQAYTAGALIDFSKTQNLPVVSISQGTLGTNPTLRVSVSYTFHGLGLGNLFDQLGQPWVMNASTVMVYE